MSALSELLAQRVAAQKIGVREIARRAQERGHTLSHGTVSKYLSGRHPEVPAEETLRALHDVLGIPLEQLREAAGLPVGLPEPYRPPAEADRLDPEQREAVDQVIRLLARKSVMGNAQQPAPKTPAGDEPASKVHDLNQPDQDRDMDARVAELLAGPHAARRGTPEHAPDDTTGEESQAGPEGGQ